MRSKSLNPSKTGFWIRIGLMTLAFVGIVSLIAYLRSGQVEQNPDVQALLNPPPVPERKAKVIFDPPASAPTQAPAPTKDR